MSTLRPEQYGFVPAPERTWPDIDKASLRDAVEQLKAAAVARHEREREDHAANRPGELEDLQRKRAWEAQERQMTAAQSEETARLARLEQDISKLPEQLNRLRSSYGSRRAAQVAAYAREWNRISDQIEQLQSLKAERQNTRGALKRTREELVTLLQENGVHANLGENLSGWEVGLHQALLDEDCQFRGISRENAPVLPALPDQPRPLPVYTAQKEIEQKRFDPANFIMLLGGMVFAASAGAAIGGIHFDSLGWHLEGVFYVLFLACLAISYMIGEYLFPWLLGLMILKPIDLHPYYRDEASKKEHRTKARRSVLLAGLGIAAIFITFAMVDYYGWWRAAIEYAAAHADEEGFVAPSPVLAGAAMCLLTVLAAASKVGSIAKKMGKQRELIDQEVLDNEATYKSRVTEHNDAMQRRNALSGKVTEYERLLAEATANAKDRYNRKAPPLQQKIEAYRGQLARANESMQDDPDAKIQSLIVQARQSVLPEDRAVEEVVQQIDAAYEAAAGIESQVAAA